MERGGRLGGGGQRGDIWEIGGGGEEERWEKSWGLHGE